MVYVTFHVTQTTCNPDLYGQELIGQTFFNVHPVNNVLVNVNNTSCTILSKKNVHT